VYVYYLGTLPKPADLKLYEPFNNRECLHCHDGARTFEESALHSADPEIMADIKSNRLSCVSSGCHDQIHQVGTISERKLWELPAQ